MSDTKDTLILLEVRNLTKIFKKGKRFIKANDNISFRVKKGEIIGILGPNGAGKTTLIKQIANLLIPDAGDIFYKNKSILKNPKIIKGKFSFLFEGMRNVYPYLTGEANLLYFAYLNHIPLSVSKKRAEKLLKGMGLWEFKDEYVFNYSSGMVKKLAIATCLINDPEIIFLDEPLSGLDVIAAEELSDLIRELVRTEKKTFLISSHRMEFIEKVTQQVIWLKDGKIIFKGSTDEIKNFYKKDKKIYLYFKNSPDIPYYLNRKNIKFEIISDKIIRVELSIFERELFYYMIKNFELINIEKKETDFELIFKELYNATHTKS